MPLQQFDNQDSLRAQRMTADEAKAVIALWQQERGEQTGLTDKPAVSDIAEALDITTEDVVRLLGNVREEQARAQTQMQTQWVAEGRRFAGLQQQRREQEAADQRLGQRAFGIIILVLLCASLLIWMICAAYDHSLPPQPL